MPNLPRDTILAPKAPPLLPGESLLHSPGSDQDSDWHDHDIVAVIGGFVAAMALDLMHKLTAWVGQRPALTPYLVSLVLGLTRHLPNRRLLGLNGRTIRLANIKKATP